MTMAYADQPAPLRLALAHEYFAVHGGAEAVVEVLHAMWPAAPVHALFHDRARYGALAGWDLRLSPLQSLPHEGGLHRLLLPLYPWAASRLAVAEGTDVALTSTSAFVKGLTLPARTVHVAYCHAPTRYLWDARQTYLAEEVPAPLRPLLGPVLDALCAADLRAAARVDRWIANSAAVAERIRRFYRSESEVVHPPVDLVSFAPAAERGDFWLFVGRLSAYKRADVAVRAFARLGLRLIVVGEGRERGRLETLAHDNVEFTGRVDEETKRRLLGAARGLVFPAEDDFGIACVEALASGAPVVAYGAGGAPEIVRDGIEGALVPAQDADAFADAVLRVERAPLDPVALRASAARFDVGRFRERVAAIVADAFEKGRTT